MARFLLVFVIRYILGFSWYNILGFNEHHSEHIHLVFSNI